MKNLIFTLLFIASFSFVSNGQIVITEIMYNSPDAGQDSTEYIEIYNAGTTDVDISNYSFTQGVEYVFTAGTIMPAASYLVVTNDAAAYSASYGVAAFQWDAGGLSNGGEDIIIVDGIGNEVDLVDYSDGGDWPDAADGTGPSLELCDPNVDNSLASNWKASTNPTGVIFEGTEVFATPGVANSVNCDPTPDHVITLDGILFTPNSLTINVGDLVEWQWIGGIHNVDGNTTDYPSNPESFTSGDPVMTPNSYSRVFTLPGTYNYHCDVHLGDGMTGVITVLQPDIPDIVITEIMYNNPGNDDLEFIELYNNDTDAVNLEGYQFTEGIVYTFPSVTVAAGEYVVVCIDSLAMEASFGVTAWQWTSGSVNNSGEDVILVDNFGNQVDIVVYSDSAPWPEISDGEGPSIVLCDVTADNIDPANWSFSTSPTGVNYGNSQGEIFASPGMQNNACALVPQLFLEGIAESAGEGDGTAFVNVSMAGLAMGDSASVELNLVVGGTATNGADYNYVDTVLTFVATEAGDRVTRTVEIEILDDTEEEADETFTLTIANASNGAEIATSGDLTVTIIDNDGIPAYPIGLISTTDAEGVADSLDVVCEIQGVVYGINYRPSGLSFTVIDEENDGINVFNFNDNQGYTVVEGDEIVVIGTIDQFNGLLEIIPDSIALASTGNTLFDPTVITVMDEEGESQLVRVNGVTMVDPSQWAGDGSSYNVEITDGTNNFVLRIDSDSEVASMAAPTGSFDVIGIGGQFDNESPFTEGYQIFPRFNSDIIPIVAPVIMANNDMVVTDINMDVTINLLGNDNLPNEITNLGIVDQPTSGMLVVNTDNTATYSPDMDFCGDDSFTYEICDAMACDTATVNITVNCANSYPLYPIGDVTALDAEGVPDSIGVQCEIQGIVYGINLRPGGLQFTIIDENNQSDGIGLFSGSENFGYTVAEGDKVSVTGVIGQFSGLTQINPDNVSLISSGNGLFQALVVDDLSENSESNLVKMEGMTIVDPTQWTNSGSGFNVAITNGLVTVDMRIDQDVTDIYGMDPFDFPFDVTGIGSQFDGDAPFDSGYQLLPRYLADIEEIVISTEEVDIQNSVRFFPNPASSQVQLLTEGDLDQISVHNLLGQKVLDIQKPASKETLQVEAWPAGIYSISFEKEGVNWTSKLIVQ